MFDFNKNWLEFISELEKRNFQGIDDISSRNKCFKDKHYLLYTDGMLIYSYDCDPYNRNCCNLIVEWFNDEFSWKQLDDLINESSTL